MRSALGRRGSSKTSTSEIGHLAWPKACDPVTWAGAAALCGPGQCGVSDDASLPARPRTRPLTSVYTGPAAASDPSSLRWPLTQVLGFVPEVMESICPEGDSGAWLRPSPPAPRWPTRSKLLTADDRHPAGRVLGSLAPAARARPGCSWDQPGNRTRLRLLSALGVIRSVCSRLRRFGRDEIGTAVCSWTPSILTPAGGRRRRFGSSGVRV